MRNVVIVVTIAILAGCEYNNIPHQKPATENYVPLTDNYLPLTIGNYWDFEMTTPSQNRNTIQIHREVISTVTINHQEYYLLITISTYNIYNDSSYYRIDSNGFVYIYHKSNPNFEDNRFRLNGNDHDTWSYPVEGGDQAQVTLTVETITLGNVLFHNSKNYYYDVIRRMDEEYSIILAPGIGFIEEYNGASGLDQELKSAKIDGRVFNF